MTLTLNRDHYVDLWNYLAPSDLLRNHQVAITLANSLATLSGANFIRHGVNVVDAARQDLVWPFELMANAYDALRAAFADLNVRSCEFFEQPGLSVIRTGPPPLLAAGASLTVAIMKYLAAETGVPCIAIGDKPIARDDGKRVASLRTTLQPHSPLISRRGTSSPVVVVLDNGLRPAESSGIASALSTGAVPAVRFWEMAHPVFHRFIDLDPGSESLKQEWNRAASAFHGWRANYDGEYRHLVANPFSTFQFDRLWEEILRAAKLMDIAHALFLRLQPTGIVLGHDAFTIERSIVGVAQQLHIPVFAVLHGGLCHRIGYSGIVGDADTILAWNDLDVAELARVGVDARRVRVIGRIGGPMGPSRRPAKRSFFTIDRRRSSEHRPRVLFLTAATHAAFAHPIAKPELHRQAWLELIALASDLNNWDFVIKPHPTYDHFEFLRVVSAASPSNLVLREKATLNECLDEADMVVLVNYLTTAALDAMMAGVPVLLLNNAIYPTDAHEPILGPQDVTTVPTVADLRAAMIRLVDDVVEREVVTAHAEAVAVGLLHGNQVRPATDLLKDMMSDTAVDTCIPFQRQGTNIDPEPWAQDYVDALMAPAFGHRLRRVVRDRGSAHIQAVKLFATVAQLTSTGQSGSDFLSGLVRGSIRLRGSFFRPAILSTVLRMRSDLLLARSVLRFARSSRILIGTLQSRVTQGRD